MMLTTTATLIFKSLKSFCKISSKKSTKTMQSQIRRQKRCSAPAIPIQIKSFQRNSFIKHCSCSQSQSMSIRSLKSDQSNNLSFGINQILIDSQDIFKFIEMVSKSDIAEMASKLFDDYDTDNSNGLDIKEFKVILTALFKEVNHDYVITQDKMNKMFSICDTNSDKKLSRKEFIKCVEMFLEPVYVDPIPKK